MQDLFWRRKSFQCIHEVIRVSELGRTSEPWEKGFILLLFDNIENSERLAGVALLYLKILVAICLIDEAYKTKVSDTVSTRKNRNFDRKTVISFISLLKCRNQFRGGRKLFNLNVFITAAISFSNSIFRNIFLLS